MNTNCCTSHAAYAQTRNRSATNACSSRRVTIRKQSVKIWLADTSRACWAMDSKSEVSVKTTYRRGACDEMYHTGMGRDLHSHDFKSIAGVTNGKN